MDLILLRDLRQPLHELDGLAGERRGDEGGGHAEAENHADRHDRGREAVTPAQPAAKPHHQREEQVGEQQAQTIDPMNGRKIRYRT